MATNTLIMSYVLKKFKNARSSSNNRWFAYVNKTGTLSTRGLAQHMIEHGLIGICLVTLGLTSRPRVSTIIILLGAML